jgi:PKD domain
MEFCVSDDGAWIGHAWLHGQEDIGPFSIVSTFSGRSYSFRTTEPPNKHTIQWNFGDGGKTNSKTGVTVEHTYSQDGTFTVIARCHKNTSTTVVNVGGGTPLPPESLRAYDGSFALAFG